MRSLPVFQMQFALVEVEIARIKHRAQHFVRNIISNAVAQQSLNHFQLSSRYIWFPSYACASLHFINCHRHWSWFKACNVLWQSRTSCKVLLPHISWGFCIDGLFKEVLDGAIAHLFLTFATPSCALLELYDLLVGGLTQLCFGLLPACQAELLLST